MTLKHQPLLSISLAPTCLGQGYYCLWILSVCLSVWNELAYFLFYSPLIKNLFSKLLSIHFWFKDICQSDICPGNICPGDISPTLVISEIFILTQNLFGPIIFSVKYHLVKYFFWSIKLFRFLIIKSVFLKIQVEDIANANVI